MIYCTIRQQLVVTYYLHPIMYSTLPKQFVPTDSDFVRIIRILFDKSSRHFQKRQNTKDSLNTKLQYTLLYTNQIYFVII